MRMRETLLFATGRVDGSRWLHSGRWRAKQHVEVICRQQRQHQAFCTKSLGSSLTGTLSRFFVSRQRFRDAMGIIAHVCQLRTDQNFWRFELMMSPDSRQMLSAWTSLHRASNLAQRGPARRRMVTCWALWQLGARTSADKNEQYMSS